MNGKKALIVAVQMNEGNNIVDFGDDVSAAIARVTELIPSNIEISLVANQPALVNQNVGHFLSEFLIAIIAVRITSYNVCYTKLLRILAISSLRVGKPYMR